MHKRSSPPPIVTYATLVGKIVALQRESLNIKQGEIAAAIGLSQSAYSRLESGDSIMSVTQLRNVANQLGMDPNRLLRLADTYEDTLRKQGVKVISEKTDDTAALLVGLGLLAALLISAR
jgi:transcriptional regulator with XRE-family HTH domain